MSRSIMTKTGDKGLTSMASGARVSKTDPWIEAYGTADELTSMIGFARSQGPHLEVEAVLKKLQHQLHTFMATLAFAGKPPASCAITEKHLKWAEEIASATEAKLAPLTKFILPGGHPAAAALHMARTICRRMERSIIAIENPGSNLGLIIRYANRLSDLLFILARYQNRQSEIPDECID